VRASLYIERGETVTWEILKNDIIILIKFAAVFIIIGIVVSAILATVLIFLQLILGANFFSASLIGLFTMIVAAVTTALFFPAPFIIADKKDVSIIDSLKKSFNIVSKNIPHALIFAVVCLAINIICSIPLAIGLIITVPISMIAAAIVYKKFETVSAANIEKGNELGNTSN
jgi:uncharacterized membrane protein